MEKRGELTTQQIVMLIILITSFAVILFFIFRLNLGETTDKEICHNSVILKSKSKIGGELDCKTNYVCISGGGVCTGINPSVTIDINLENGGEEIIKALAQEMADCWWVFGEGKVDYVGTPLLKDKVQCSICSIIAFDENIKKNEKLGEINYGEFYDSLSTLKKDDSENYLPYLYSFSGVSDLKKAYESYLPDYFSNTFDFNKQYFVLTGRFAEGRITFFDPIIENRPIPVTILEKTTENYGRIGCSEFLTKA